MKAFLSLILFLLSLNAYTEENPINFEEQIKSLKLQIEDKKNSIKELEELRKTYFSEKSKDLLISAHPFNKKERILYSIFSGFSILLFSMLDNFIYHSSMDGRTLNSEIIDLEKNKFLRFLKRRPVAISSFLIFVLNERYFSYQSNKTMSEFEDLYQNYKDSNQLVLKDESLKESLAQMDRYQKVIDHYKDYFQKEENFDSFLSLLTSSLKKDEEKLKKLQKNFEVSTQL